MVKLISGSTAFTQFPCLCEAYSCIKFILCIVLHSFKAERVPMRFIGYECGEEIESVCLCCW
jgi:hypothetical protein